MGWPPIATPRRDSSARPRVMTAALVLSPVPSPSAIPAAIAMTFFSAPATSQPTTSGFDVDAEQPLMERLLQSLGHDRVGHGDDRRGGIADEDLLGQVRPGEHGRGMAGHHLVDDLGHAQACSLLEALRQTT